MQFLQNFFRLYGKLSGMTGTAMTEEEEFAAIYNLDIIEIPTNKPVIRIDNPDVVYKNEAGKLRAIIEQIRVCHGKGQPVLVGTVSIEKSEQLSKLLRKAGIPHNVLNAKHHEKEAEIVAQAGKFGAVTIATNMAGRGTDIMLGGNAEYMAKSELRKLVERLDGTITLTPEYGQDTNVNTMLSAKLNDSSIAVSVSKVEEVYGGAGIAADGTITYFYADPNTTPLVHNGSYNVTFALSKAGATETLQVPVVIGWDGQPVRDRQGDGRRRR